MSVREVRDIHVANTFDLRDGEMKEISVDERRILLARVGDNFHAVSATCPHYGGPLAEGVLCGTRIVCPWHHAAFNIVNGDLEDPPALDSLVRYDLRVEGDRSPLSPGVDLSAYRIVQEALTNVVKHAGAATAQVTVRYARDSVEVEVCDDGRSHGFVSGGGNGLIGMRERVAMLGGEFRAGACESGGFAVFACLPLAGPTA